jgi:hypothetical protein
MASRPALEGIAEEIDEIANSGISFSWRSNSARTVLAPLVIWLAKIEARGVEM